MAKGKSGGGGGAQNTVMAWSILLSSLALFLLIMLILFGNLSGNVGFTTIGSTIQVNNETPSWVNSTNYTFAVTNSSTSGYIILRIWNVTADLVPSGFYQVDGDVIFTNGTDFPGPNFTNTTYTYVYTTDSTGLKNTNDFIGNYTQSVLNVGKQFPVVGTIIGIALLLLILIGILVFALKKMGAVSSQGSSGGNFG